MHIYKKYIAVMLGTLGLLAITQASSVITLPTALSTIFSNLTTQNNSVHFQWGGNNFQGALLRGATQTLNTPETVEINGTTTQCSKKVTGAYYNDQRGARRWPLDSATLASLVTTNSNYNTVTLSGGLFTNCNGRQSTAVIGQIIHTFTGGYAGTYKLAAGLNYNFNTNDYTTTGFANTLTHNGSTASGYVYDSAGGIGLLGSNIIINNPPTTGNTGNNGGGNGGNGGGGGGSLSQDNCPNGDNSPSYYDGSCGSLTINNSISGSSNNTGLIIGIPQGKACAYNDEQYISKGPFNDTIKHRGLPYIEILRLSCVSRGIATKQGGRLFAPEQSITRAEVFKVVAKIMGVAFDDLTITNEDKAYNGATPFADVPANHWFAHYADYMYKYGMMDGLVDTDKNGNKYFHPDQPMQRYEAIKAIMLAYKKINPADINIAGQSVMGDVIDKNNPYYKYIRAAEVLGFISGIPQENGSYNFAGQNKITRAEFAKIVGVPFMQQLMDVEDAARNSNLYKMIQEAVAQTQSDKITFVNNLFASLATIDDKAFLKSFKVDKKIFLKVLQDYILAPLVAQEQ